MKVFKTTLLSAMLCAVTVPAVSANTGTLNLKGKISPSTCSVPSAELTRTIRLAEIPTARLVGAPPGDKITSEDFAFNFTSCPAGLSNVGIRFDFTGDRTHPEYMTNTGDSSGVLLGVTNESDVRINAGDSIMSDDYDDTTGTGSVKAKVWAYRIGNAAPVSGTIASQATVTVITQ